MLSTIHPINKQCIQNTNIGSSQFWLKDSSETLGIFLKPFGMILPNFLFLSLPLGVSFAPQSDCFPRLDQFPLQFLVSHKNISPNIIFVCLTGSGYLSLREFGLTQDSTEERLVEVGFYEGVPVFINVKTKYKLVS